GGAVAHLANLLLALGGVLTRLDKLADFLRFGFAQRLELFGFGKRGAPLGVESAKSFDVERETAIRQAGGDGVEILPEKREIVHRAAALVVGLGLSFGERNPRLAHRSADIFRARANQP